MSPIGRSALTISSNRNSIRLLPKVLRLYSTTSGTTSQPMYFTDGSRSSNEAPTQKSPQPRSTIVAFEFSSLKWAAMMGTIVSTYTSQARPRDPTPEKTGATHPFPTFGFDKPLGMLFGDDNGQGARLASNWRKKKARFCSPNLASF